MRSQAPKPPQPKSNGPKSGPKCEKVIRFQNVEKIVLAAPRKKDEDGDKKEDEKKEEEKKDEGLMIWCSF